MLVDVANNFKVKVTVSSNSVPFPFPLDVMWHVSPTLIGAQNGKRSEERRVGKEC